ncbi:MAG: hypothetical protein OEV44_11905 [Spirochaetota bacterium]|nr:hypothetical protein [Spirochaetota bacterium]
MEINKALSQISEIHGHLAKTEVFRGIESKHISLAGVLTVISAYFQPYFVESPNSFLIYWSSIALINIIFASCVISFNYYKRESIFDRKRTLRTVGQFLPSLIGGLFISVALSVVSDNNIRFLPGIWTVLFALGISSSLPFLPKAVGWVAIYFFLASINLFYMINIDLSLSPWGMGLSFGGGLFLAAIILYLNVERKVNVRKRN